MSLSVSSSPELLVGGGGCAGSTLSPGVGLAGGGYLCSPSNGYTFIMQTNGNLVEYNSLGQALWASDTSGQSENYVVMQRDGNLVIYSSSGQARWETGTYGIGGGFGYLSLQSYSNVVIYDSSGAIWAVRWLSSQTYAQEIMFHFGWGSDQWQYLYDLWTDESGWRWYVCYGYPSGPYYPNCPYNSVAYGIPQEEPSTRANYDSWPDWPTDPFTQVTFSKQYIYGRYGDPENAWNYATNNGTCPIGSDGLPTECSGGYAISGIN